MSDREAFETDPRFLALGAQDRNCKIKRHHEIAVNWECDTQECVPVDLRPRALDGSRKLWWQCSEEFVRQLGKISFLTRGNLAFAQDLMSLEVNERLRSVAGFRTAAEIKTRDLTRIHEALIKSPEPENLDENDDDSDFGRAKSDEGVRGDREQRALSANNKVPNGHSESDNYTTVPIKGEIPDGETSCNPMHAKRRMLDGGSNHTNTNITAPVKRQKLGSSSSTATPAKIAALRGRAMRFEQKASTKRAEAAKMEAEAAKLKAEAYEAEANWLLSE